MNVAFLLETYPKRMQFTRFSHNKYATIDLSFHIAMVVLYYFLLLCGDGLC